MSLGDLETFITEQEKGSITSEPEKVDSPVVREYGGNLLDSLSEMHNQESGKNDKQWYILYYIPPAWSQSL